APSRSRFSPSRPKPKRRPGRSSRSTPPQEKTMNVKNAMIASAVASMFLAGAARAGDKGKTEKKTASAVKCAGINECKGHGSCSGADNSCKSHNECKG